MSFSQNIHLKLKGQDSISTKYITTLEHTNTFKDINSLQNELKRLQQKLTSNGYFNNHITEASKINDSTYTTFIKINTHYKTIHITYNNKQLTKKDISAALNHNTDITEHSFTTPTKTLENDLNRILKHYSKKGQVFTNFKLTNIRIQKQEVFAELQLNNSKTTYISAIKIKGYDDFPKKFTKHYLRLKKNQKLNLEDIEEKSNKLNHLLFANEKKKPEILFTKDSAITYLYINKKRANAFEGFIGFSTNPETNKLNINGNIDLKLTNNLNTGEELHIKYHATENKQRNIHLKTNIPYILNTPFSIEGQFQIFKKDSSFTNNTQSLLIKYNISKNIAIGSGVRFNSSNSITEISNNTVDFRKNSYLFNLTHKTPNNQNSIFKTKTQTHFELSLSKRKTITKTDNQQNVYLSSEYLFQINRTNTFYIRNESNYLISNNIFENEQLYIGGINSIRGYQENSIPSTQYSILNTEYRIELSNNLYTHTVIDYAITQELLSKKNNNLFGFGLGFGLKSNNSLLRFIIANKKNKDENIKFSESKIHLSLSTFF